MTFLQLVQQLVLETGTDLNTRVDTVSWPPSYSYGESSQHIERCINWVRRAWLDLQEDQAEWGFMLHRAAMPMAEGQWSYPVKELVDAELLAQEEPYTFERLVPFTAYLDQRFIWVADGSNDRPGISPCYYIPYEQFYGMDDQRNRFERGRPARYTVGPDERIEFDRSPENDDFYAEFLFRHTPQELTTNDEEPIGLPPRFHDLIVYYAIEHYAGYDETNPQYIRAKRLTKRLRNKLRMKSTPEYTMVGTKG